MTAGRAIRQFGLFAGVGVVNTLVDFTVFAVLFRVFGVAPLPAHIVAYACGTANSFLMNGTLTFGRPLRDIMHWRIAALFAVTVAIQLALTSLVLVAAIGLGASPYFAKVISILVGMAANFAMSRYIFAPGEPAPDAREKR
jgi:putative flippase GtrA